MNTKSQKNKSISKVNTITKQTIQIFERLDEVSQISVLKFAEFLVAQREAEDIKLYDEAKLNDCGYRISSEDLRAKYGI